jgi:hypothetical protein
MVEINNSNFRDKGQKVIIDKISKAAKELRFPSDKITFIEQMISLSRLLMEYDFNVSTAFRTIDEKAQDPTYFVATYFDTKDLQQALWVYRMVRLLTRYILVYDRYSETGKNRYDILARNIRKSINKIFENEIDRHHLKYSIDFSLKQFWPFWKFEQTLKRLIIEGNTFSYNEIRNFNLFKSSDASLIYARVLDAKLPSFSENVSLVLHYNQALLDLKDDWEDIEEDIQEDMPNAFVMAAIENVPYNVIKKCNVTNIRHTIFNSLESSNSPIMRLVDEYHASIRNISVPSNLVFIKLISDHHANTLRKAISL